MKLPQLLSVFPELKWGNDPLKEVKAVCSDSRQLEPGCVFVAIRGGRHDGHDHLDAAAAQGAIALVVEDESRVPGDYEGAVVVTDDARTALNILASRFFGDPAGELFCVGVTGTNGKTTTTYLIEAILTEFGWPTGVIGTINHHLGTKVWNTEMTTPDPVSFQKRLREFVALNAQALAMEVSSHALAQARVDSVPFDIAVFTNLSRDHLDYHRDMDDYFQAKLRLFAELMGRSTKPNRLAVVNNDDEYGRRINAPAGVKLWTYGQAEADFAFKIKSVDFSGTRFHLKTPQGSRDFFVPMAGIYNVYNAVAAIAAGVGAGATLETCARALEGFAGVKGRLEAVPNDKGVHVFVDFAHTDAALVTVLDNLKAIRRMSGTDNQIITVFGCGGDRDKGKRPLMMQAALGGSDRVVVTSDNPRTEDPEQIIRDALAGAPKEAIGSRVVSEVDRRKGIIRALREARPGDVVLIAGKGHETYQQIGTTKIEFSDAAVVREFLG